MSHESNEFDEDELYEPEGGYPVTAPSGAIYTVLNQEEVNVYLENVERYLHDNHFTNVSDLKELDRVLFLELVCWRWANWLSQDHDYDDLPVDSKLLQQQIKDFSSELRLLKKSLGIDKGTRDKDKGATLSDQWTNLLRRAKEFGYHRNEQFTQTLILFNDLCALVQLHDNCTEDEQLEMHCTQKDVIAWIRDVAIPEYKKLDDQFTNQQRMWVREL